MPYDRAHNAFDTMPVTVHNAVHTLKPDNSFTKGKQTKHKANKREMTPALQRGHGSKQGQVPTLS
eukprot:1141022-Pelagomonas_calceolata.AAC.4